MSSQDCLLTKKDERQWQCRLQIGNNKYFPENLGQ